MSMKTAISIPDDIFMSAERLAKQMNISRSEFYRYALERYIAECRHVGVKEQLDKVYASQNSSVDPAFLKAQTNSITREDW